MGHNSFPALTGLRGFAALWVLTYHAWVEAGPAELTFSFLWLGPIEYHPLFGSGWAGVQIFFALSAFLLTLPFAEASVAREKLHFDKRAFLARRLVRVFPAYYLQLLVLLVLGLWVDSLGHVTPSDTVYLLTMNFLPEPLGYGHPSDINGVWWTLPIELSFYLLVPLIAPLAVGRYKWQFFLGSLGFMFAWRFGVIANASPDTIALWFSQLPGSADSFAIGIITAYLFATYRIASDEKQAKIMRLSSMAISLAGLIVIGLIYWLDSVYWLYRTEHITSYIWTVIFSAAVGLLIFFCAAKHRFLTAVFGNWVAEKFGVISYGIYLWHLPIATWFGASTYAQTSSDYLFPHYLIIMIAGASAIATVSWVLVERPSINFVRRYLTQKSGP